MEFLLAQPTIEVDKSNENMPIGPKDVAITPLGLAVVGGFPEVVRMLLRAGANINKGIHTPLQTPLYLAVRCNNLKLVEFLLQEGANVNLGLQEKTLRSYPIVAAIVNKNVEMVKTLLKFGASATLPLIETFNTPIFLTIIGNYPEVW